MEEKTLYEKAEKAINQAFEAAKVSVKAVSKKAGEAAHITKLLIEKATLEHRVSKKFAELGNRVFERAMQEDQTLSFEEGDIKSLIADAKRLDNELSRVEKTLDRERKTKKPKKTAA